VKFPPLPKTRKEWQNLVDASHGALALDSARKYGLIKGGPTVDIERAEYFLMLGRNRGITPSPDAVEQFTRELMAEQAAKPYGGGIQ
jgi:hypothetical protein